MENEIRLLNQAIRRLLTSGENAPSGEELTGLSREILDRADRLYPSCGQTATEEASLCATLLMAYNTSMYGPADRLERVNRRGRGGIVAAGGGGDRGGLGEAAG